MGSSEKVAISLDGELLLQAERLHKATGETRSALIARALRLLLREQERARMASEYVDAYRRAPETTEDASRARALTNRSIPAVEWDD